MSKHDDRAAPAATPAQDSRATWTAPKVIRMRAGDAEMPGANPLRAEGAFATGS